MSRFLGTQAPSEPKLPQGPRLMKGRVRKHYITNKPGEIAMAIVQLECTIGAAWMFWAIDSIFIRWCVAHLIVVCPLLIWNFLFNGMGSYERRKAAETAFLVPAREVTHG